MKCWYIFDLPVKEKEIKRLEEEMLKNSFWSNQKNAHGIIRKVKALKNIVDKFKDLQNMLEEITILFELNIEENSQDIWEEIIQKINVFEESFKKQELIFIFDDDYDKNNAIATIRPGAGGTESQDWAEMLLRMYLKWAEKNGYSAKIIEISPAEEAGIKNVTFTICGEFSYGHLKAENGIHRLVRISPFDSNKRRHTSFASMEVIPEIDEEVNIDIKESDLRIDTYRASGAGGQHVNTTDSAVRITHLPTNIVVQCQNERSQYSNKITAMKVLRARLFMHYQEEKAKGVKEIRGKKKEIAWGSQIRSYVFHPYQMIKDHRTEVESGNTQAIMNGEINIFIEAYLKSKKINEQAPKVKGIVESDKKKVNELWGKKKSERNYRRNLSKDQSGYGLINKISELLFQASIDPDYISPNLVANIAAQNNIELDADEVVEISDNYDKWLEDLSTVNIGWPANEKKIIKIGKKLNENAQIGDTVIFNKQKGNIIGQTGGNLIVQVQGSSELVNPSEVKVMGTKVETIKPPFKFSKETQKLLFEQYVKCGIYMGQSPIKTNDCYVRYSDWTEASNSDQINIVVEGQLTLLPKEQIKIFEDINTFANLDNYIEGVIIDEVSEEALENVRINVVDYTEAIGDADPVRIIRGGEGEDPGTDTLPKARLRTLAV